MPHGSPLKMAMQFESRVLIETLLERKECDISVGAIFAATEIPEYMELIMADHRMQSALGLYASKSLKRHESAALEVENASQRFAETIQSVLLKSLSLRNWNIIRVLLKHCQVFYDSIADTDLHPLHQILKFGNWIALKLYFDDFRPSIDRTLAKWHDRYGPGHALLLPALSDDIYEENAAGCLSILLRHDTSSTLSLIGAITRYVSEFEKYPEKYGIKPVFPLLVNYLYTRQEDKHRSFHLEEAKRKHAKILTALFKDQENPERLTVCGHAAILFILHRATAQFGSWDGLNFTVEGLASIVTLTLHEELDQLGTHGARSVPVWASWHVTKEGFGHFKGLKEAVEAGSEVSKLENYVYPELSQEHGEARSAQPINTDIGGLFDGRKPQARRGSFG